MCSSTHHIIVPSDSDVGDAFSSTNTSGYIIASPDYFPALPGNTSPDFLEHLSKDLLASLTISPFHDDPYMKIMQAYNAISNESHIPSQAPIAPPIILPSSPVMAPKRTSTSAAPPMTQDVIKKLVADSVAAALEAQAATMENTNNTNRNTRQSGTPIARKCSYKEFMICQPFNFKVSDLQQRGSSDQELQKQRASHWKQPAASARADRSFVSVSLASILNISPITLDTTYDIEMADGNLIDTNTVIQGCNMTLLNQPFKIDLMPIKLGSFEVSLASEGLGMCPVEAWFLLPSVGGIIEIPWPTVQSEPHTSHFVWIKREYSNVRTPQQNGVTERKNGTLIKVARTMLADLFLPNTFWAEAVSTTCYVLNRVLVTKPQNKTPYGLIAGKIPIISYIRPFGCHVTILNTIDHLGKFEGKSDEGFLVGYSLNSKAFRVYNLETKRVEENLHITFLENKPNVAGKGPNWLLDLDYLTDLMNYQPVRSENQANKTADPKEANHSACTQDNIDVGNPEMESESAQDYFVLPIWSSYTLTAKSSEAKNEGEKPNKNTGLKTNEEPVDQEDQAFLEELERLKRQENEANDAAEALGKEFAQDTEDLLLQARAARATSTNTINIASTPVSTVSPSGGLS
ncbi:putative ribonuclease H-like domain-containing protein, partial [Tanacetum coccineum]